MTITAYIATATATARKRKLPLYIIGVTEHGQAVYLDTWMRGVIIIVANTSDDVHYLVRTTSADDSVDAADEMAQDFGAWLTTRASITQREIVQDVLAGAGVTWIKPLHLHGDLYEGWELA
jgi:hypothetical protein